MKHKLKDPGSAITHFIGMLMTIFAATPLLIKAAREPDHIHVISLAIFIGSMILLYAASTLYHSLDLSEKINRRLRKLDHMMIFLLIAGSYTPICLVVLERPLGLYLCALVWAIAIVGIIIKAFWITCPKWFSSLLYIAMGSNLRSCLYTDFKFASPSCICLAACRRYYLHNRWNHLCPETSCF